MVEWREAEVCEAEADRTGPVVPTSGSQEAGSPRRSENTRDFFVLRGEVGGIKIPLIAGNSSPSAANLVAPRKGFHSGGAPN